MKQMSLNMNRSKFICLVLGIFLFISPVFASISEDAKKAVKEYVGYPELQNRGFKINMLDKIQTPEDLYKVLLPYMIVDGKPLDNTLSFNGFNFARHKTIHFKDIYGTISQLEKKGYKTEQMFYYPSKGKDIYRIGEFVWENSIPVPSIWSDVVYYNKPFIGKNLAYFFVGSFYENYFKPYINDIKKKNAIVVDLRLFSGNWEYQLYLLGESLCSANYQGKIILIMDKTTSGENGINNAIRQEYYINGSQKKVKFEWITVGENTYGKQAFIYDAKWNYKVGDLQFNPLPVKKNQWTYGVEGEGYIPEIWAVGEDDINKTIELLTNEPDFGELIKPVTLWRNYLCSSEKALWNWPLQLPDSVKKIKSYDEYNKAVSDLLNITIELTSLINENGDYLYQVGGWYYDTPACVKSTKNPVEFTAAYKKWLEARIKITSFIVNNSDKNINCWIDYPDCFANCSSFTTYADYFSKWVDKRIELYNILENSNLKNYYLYCLSAPSSKKVKNIQDYWLSFEKQIDAEIKWVSFIVRNNNKDFNYWVEYPDCFANCNSFTTYADYFSKWIDKRLEWCNIVANNDLTLYKPYIQGIPCIKTTNNIQDYWTAFEKQIDAEIRWVNFLVTCNGKEIDLWQNCPKCLFNCNSYKTFADCYSKFVDIRITWDDFYIKNLKGVNYVWWAYPDFFESIKNPEEYTDYYVRWINLRLWWCDILAKNQYVFKHNTIPVWYDALKTEIKEWNNPEKHLTELSAYLKNLEPWIEYLQPHTYVIPKNREMANLYRNKYKTSEKIGNKCSAVPEEITKLQKSNPEVYMNKIVEYINKVAENDFEKVKLFFDIEQEILVYDHDTFRKDMVKINEAKKGVVDDYEKYLKNWNDLNKDTTEERAKQDWKSVLENGTCVCEGYARLMQQFCYKIGLKCDIVSDPRDMMFVPGHAWNIVQINGEDYLVDATWGLSYLFMEPDAFFKAGHFPTEPEQQLLEKPMTLDEYKILKNYKGNK